MCDSVCVCVTEMEDVLLCYPVCARVFVVVQNDTKRHKVNREPRLCTPLQQYLLSLLSSSESFESFTVVPFCQIRGEG